MREASLIVGRASFSAKQINKGLSPVALLAYENFPCRGITRCKFETYFLVVKVVEVVGITK